jgi:hypothetical protein
VAVVAFFTAGGALWFRNSAIQAERLARARLLVSEGRRIAADNPLLGLRLALEGLAVAPVADTQLVSDTADLPATGRVLSFGNDVESITPSPDGSLVVIKRSGGQSELRRTTDGAKLQSFTKEKEPYIFFIPNPRASVFAVVYGDRTAELRRTSDGVLQESLPGPVFDIAFSRNPGASVFEVVLRG